MIAVRFALAVALALAAGLAILSRLSKTRRSGPGAIGLGFFVGALATALWTHLLLWGHVPVTTLTVLMGPALIAATGRRQFLRELAWSRPPIAALLIAPAAAFMVWGALSTRSLGYDPDTMYLFRAKSIAHHGTFWNEDFTDPARLHLGHRRPLLLPAMVADVALLSGSWNGRLIRLWFALLQIAAFGGMYDALRRKIDAPAAALATAIYAWLPAHWHSHGGAVTGYADAPLAMIILFALTSEAPLAALLLTAGALLKDEGQAFLLPFALLRGWKPAVIPAAVAGAWLLTARGLPLDGDYLPMNFLSPHVEHLPLILRKLGSEMITWKHWSLLWVGMFFVLGSRMRRLDREESRWLLVLAMQLAIYVVVWMTFPADQIRMALRVQDMRLVLHVVPALWVWTASCRQAAAPIESPA